MAEKAGVSGALGVRYLEALVDLLFKESGIVDGRNLGCERGHEDGEEESSGGKSH